MMLRRLVTVPGYLVAWSIWMSLAPVWIMLALVSDLMRSSGGVALRSGAMIAAYLTCEGVGIAIAGSLWLYRALFGMSDERWTEIHFDLEAAWGTALFRSMTLLYGMRVELDGDLDLDRGPYLLMPRHASTGDTVLAAALISRPFGMRLRYVLKQEHLWDPCLDIVGNRVPNVFVDRSAKDSAAEVARVSRLAEGLGPKDGVLIYPEGTRFSLDKQARIRDRFAESGDAKMLEYARGLHAVLPPRTGGPLGLMEKAPDADVIFCAHVGFEGTASLADIWRGSLLNRVVRLHFRRIPAARIPTGQADRRAWLFEEWLRVGEWVEAEHRRAED